VGNGRQEAQHAADDAHRPFACLHQVGHARRSATVVALTEMLVLKASLADFRRRLPAEVLQVSRPAEH
jgi:CRP-like cAMP-binding protein